MQKKLLGIIVSMLLIATAFISVAGTINVTPVDGNNPPPQPTDWNPGDDYKMHYPQLPDEDGWDVYATSGVPGFQDIVLADDWMCTETGPVTDIHFWGSWYNDFPGVINAFVVSIYTDIPASPPDIPYSRPGELLWEWTFTQWSERTFTSTGQGWYEPHTGVILHPDHYTYYQYNIVDIPEPFIQEIDTIYWLAITALVQPEELPQPLWGWKSSADHWNDDACWYDHSQGWIDLWEPPLPPKTNLFWVELDPGGMVTPYSGGTEYYDDGTSLNGWYFYQNTGWWNIWFYDHPFDPERCKEISIRFIWWPTDVNYWIEVALNWATDWWPPGGPPPVPPLDPGEEELYIHREFIPVGPPGEPVVFDFTVPDYNPEWVSVDVMGVNVIIPEGEGLITHECLPPTEQSLDLAFVITGPPCTPGVDVEKYVWDEANADWVDADTEPDAIEVPVCTNVDFLIAIHNNGTCCDLTDIYVYDLMDDSMEFVSADPPPDFVEPVPGGTELYWYFAGPLPPCNWINITVTAHVVGPACHVDENYVMVDAYCEATGAYVYDEDSAFIHAIDSEWPDHKMHYPQLPDPSGWDVVATIGYDMMPGIAVADDWMCTETGPVTDIHFWGSWLMNMVGVIHGFWISIHADIPAPPYSRPGEELWSTYITEWNEVPMNPSPQGWYDPMQWWEYPDHDTWFRYDIENITDPFMQENQTIYWLVICADLGPPGYPEPPLWGWKTSLNHWNDDAVWAIFNPPNYEWFELYDPMSGESLDMAFVITDSMICGDVNNDGIINIGDVVYLITYLYRGGPPPIPMTCVGDVNCDGIVNIGDVVYLVTYLYRGGAAPCPNCCDPPW
jgi:hypothetical protein